MTASEDNRLALVCRPMIDSGLHLVTFLEEPPWFLPQMEFFIHASKVHFDPI